MEESEPYNSSRVTTWDPGTPDPESETALRADPKSRITRPRTYAQYRTIQLKDNDPAPWEPLTPNRTLRYVQIQKALSLACARTLVALNSATSRWLWEVWGRNQPA